MTGAPVEAVWAALDAHDCAPRGQRHKFTALCPAHEDRSPSLTVSEGGDGRALVHCFAGCPVEEIIAALGLTWRDLFDEPDPDPVFRRSFRVRRQPRYKPRRPIDTILDGLDAGAIRYRGMWIADGCPHCGAQALRITAARDGSVALACVEGCETEDVLAALERLAAGTEAA
jgi:hypothetical protein